MYRARASQASPKRKICRSLQSCVPLTVQTKQNNLMYEVLIDEVMQVIKRIEGTRSVRLLFEA